MYKPSFRHTKTGVPILSKDGIDIIAENYISDFCPEAMDTPTEIDIDSFALYYLGLKQDFQYLSNNGIYLGMTVFNDTNKVPVYVLESNSAEYISAKARTVIIDNALLEESQEHRYRFTMGHESGHDIFHASYFSGNLNHNAISRSQSMIQCRAIAQENKSSSNDNRWMEWQANYMSAALLMPKSMVIKLIDRMGDFPESLRAVMFTETTSRVFNVSTEAARNRLKGLGIIDDKNKVK